MSFCNLVTEESLVWWYSYKYKICLQEEYPWKKKRKNEKPLWIPTIVLPVAAA